MRLTRILHPQSAFNVGRVKDLAPDVQLAGMDEQGVPTPLDTATLHGVAFTDPDGETHIYVLDDEGRQELARKLTGGLVLL